MLFNFALRQQLVKDEMHRDQNGYLEEVDRSKFSYYKDTPVEIAKRNIHVMDMKRPDENTRDVYVSVDGEVVAIVRFVFADKHGILMWQPTSKFKYGAGTEQNYYYLQSRILEAARNYNTTNLITSAPQPDFKEFSVAYVTLEYPRRYEVFVSNRDGVIGSMKFDAIAEGDVVVAAEFAANPDAPTLRNKIFEVSRQYYGDVLSHLKPLLKEGDFFVTMAVLLPFNKYTIFVSDTNKDLALIEFPNATFSWQSPPPEPSEFEKGRMLELASKQHDKLVAATSDLPTQPKLTVAYGTLLDYDRYSVFVAINNEVSAAVQFTPINGDGSLFWQKTRFDSENRDAAARYAMLEGKIVSMAKKYFNAQKVWPAKSYRRDPEKDIELAF